ncbi:MAG: hypothetical protein AB1545_17565 [Thermodesulfobacteriota bacterium]
MGKYHSDVFYWEVSSLPAAGKYFEIFATLYDSNDNPVSKKARLCVYCSGNTVVNDLASKITCWLPDPADSDTVKVNDLFKEMKTVAEKLNKNTPRDVRLTPPGKKDNEDIKLWEAIKKATDWCQPGKFEDYLEGKIVEGPFCQGRPCKGREFYGEKAYEDLLKMASDFLKIEVDEQSIFFNMQKSAYDQLKGKSGTCWNDDTLKRRLENPILMELIWSYWMEEGGLIQTLNAIAIRFQNKRHPALKNTLGQFAIDPLRPLSNLLWGYIQKENDRLSLPRRLHEYSYQYGLTLCGKAVPQLQALESREKFLKSFHNLLFNSARFFRDLDDMTIRADSFPLLNSLKELQLILAEGANNQFGDMTWTTRVEMLAQCWLLDQPEMQEFFGGRILIPYKENWMRCVDTMKRLQSWTPVSITHFVNLAKLGERLLLSVRYGGWDDANDDSASAYVWADHWRDAIQGYIHAYQAATGVDLTQSSPMNYRQPSPLIHKDAA